MSDTVTNWCRRANMLSESMRKTAIEYAAFANSYEGMRDSNPANVDKSAIDAAYSKMFDARKALCSQVGGRRRRNTRKRRS